MKVKDLTWRLQDCWRVVKEERVKVEKRIDLMEVFEIENEISCGPLRMRLHVPPP